MKWYVGTFLSGCFCSWIEKLLTCAFALRGKGQDSCFLWDLKKMFNLASNNCRKTKAHFISPVVSKKQNPTDAFPFFSDQVTPKYLWFILPASVFFSLWKDLGNSPELEDFIMQLMIDFPAFRRLCYSNHLLTQWNCQPTSFEFLNVL